MLRFSIIVLVSTILMATSGCAQQQQQAVYTPVASIDDMMEGLVAPAADVVFSSVYSEISEAGIKDFAPQNDEEWGEVRHNAMALVEAGNMLKFDPEYKDKPDWEQLCQALMDSAMEVVKVTDAKNADAMLTAGGIMYESCTGCHKVYLPQEPPAE
jgi:hypothetical protein